MRKLSLSSLWKLGIIGLAAAFMAAPVFADAPQNLGNGIFTVTGLGTDAVAPNTKTSDINGTTFRGVGTSTPIFTWAASTGNAAANPGFWNTGNANLIGYVIVIATSSEFAVLTDTSGLLQQAIGVGFGSTPTAKAPWFFVFNSTMNPQPFTSTPSAAGVSSGTANPGFVAGGTVTFNFGIFGSTLGVMLRNNSTYFYNIAAFHVNDVGSYSLALSTLSVFIFHPNAAPGAVSNILVSSNVAADGSGVIPTAETDPSLVARILTSSPTFTWTNFDVDGDSLTYRVEIARDVNFTDGLVQHGLLQPGVFTSSQGFAGNNADIDGQDVVWQINPRSTFTLNVTDLSNTDIPVNRALWNGTSYFVRVITADKFGGFSTSAAGGFYPYHRLITAAPISTAGISGDVIQSGAGVGVTTPTFSWATPFDFDGSTFSYRVIITTAAGAADSEVLRTGRYPHFFMASSSGTVINIMAGGTAVNVLPTDVFTNGVVREGVGRTTFSLAGFGPLLANTSYYIRIDLLEHEITHLVGGAGAVNVSSGVFQTGFYTGNYNSQPQAAGIYFTDPADGLDIQDIPTTDWANAAVINVATPTFAVRFVSTGPAASRVDNEGNDLQIRIEISTNSAFPNDSALSAYFPSDGGLLGFSNLKSTSAGQAFGVNTAANLVAGSYSVFTSSALHPNATHFVRVIVTDTGTAAGVGLSTTSAVGAFYIRPNYNFGEGGFISSHTAADGGTVQTSLSGFPGSWTDNRFWRLHHGFPGQDGPSDDTVNIVGTTVTIPASTSVQAGTVVVVQGGVLSMQQTGALLTANQLFMQTENVAVGPSLKMAGGSTLRFRNTGNVGPYGLITESPVFGTSRSVIIATGTSASPVTIDAEDPTNGKVEFQAVWADITMNWVNFNGFNENKSSGPLTSQPAAIRLINVRTSSNTATAPSETAGLLANLSFQNTGSSSTLYIDGAAITLSGIDMNGQTFGVRTAVSGNFISSGTVSTTSVTGTIQNYAGLHKNAGANVLFNTNIAPGPVKNLVAAPSGVGDIVVTWSSPGEDATLGNLLASDNRRVVFVASSSVQSALDSIFSVAFTSFQADITKTDQGISTGPNDTGARVRVRAFTDVVDKDTAPVTAQDVDQSDIFALNGSTQQYFYRVGYLDQQGIWSALSNSASGQIQTNEPPGQIATSTIRVNGVAPTTFGSTQTVGLNFVSTNSNVSIHDQTPEISWSVPGDNEDDLLFFEVLFGTSLATGFPTDDSPPVSGSTVTNTAGTVSPFGDISAFTTPNAFFKLQHRSTGSVVGWSGSPNATPPQLADIGGTPNQVSFTLYAGSGTNRFGEDLKEVGGLIDNVTMYVTVRAWDTKNSTTLQSTGPWSSPVAFMITNSSPSWGAPQTPAFGVGLTAGSLSLGTTRVHTIRPVIGFTLPSDSNGDPAVFRVQVTSESDTTFAGANGGVAAMDTVVSSNFFTLAGSTGSYSQGAGIRNQSDGSGRGGFYGNVPGTSVVLGTGFGGTAGFGVGYPLGWDSAYIMRVVGADAPNSLGSFGFGLPSDETLSTTTVTMAFKVVNSSPAWAPSISTNAIQMSANGGASFFNLGVSTNGVESPTPLVNLTTGSAIIISWDNPADSDSDSITYRVWIGTPNSQGDDSDGAAVMVASTLSATGFSPATTSFVQGVGRSSYTLTNADITALRNVLGVRATYYVRISVIEDIAGFGRVFPATTTLVASFYDTNTAPPAVSSITTSVGQYEALSTFARHTSAASGPWPAATLSWQVPTDADGDALNFIVVLSTANNGPATGAATAENITYSSTDTANTHVTFTNVPSVSGASTMTFTATGLDYLRTYGKFDPASTYAFRPFVDNVTWYFRVWAFDGVTGSTPTQARNVEPAGAFNLSTGSFLLVNSSPSFPVGSIISGAGDLVNGNTTHTRTPVFRFSGFDADGDSLHYRVRVSSGPQSASGATISGPSNTTIAGTPGTDFGVSSHTTLATGFNSNTASGTWSGTPPYASQAATVTFTLGSLNALVSDSRGSPWAANITNNQLSGFNATYYWDVALFDNANEAIAFTTTTLSSNNLVTASASTMSFVLVNSSPTVTYTGAVRHDFVTSLSLIAGTTLFRWTSGDADSDSVVYCLMVASGASSANLNGIVEAQGLEYVSSSTVAGSLGRFFPTNTGSTTTYSVGLTSYVVNPGQLVPNVTYFWYVSATDVIPATSVVYAANGSASGLEFYRSTPPAPTEIRAFTITNTVPRAVTNLTSPLITDTPQHTRKPTFIWGIPVDDDANDLHFKLWVSTGAPTAADGNVFFNPAHAVGSGGTNLLTSSALPLESTGTATGWSGGTDTTPPYTQGTSVASFTVLSALNYNTTYFWQVVANDGFADNTAISSTGSFVLANSSPPAVTLGTITPNKYGFIASPLVTMPFTASADGNGDIQDFTLRIFNFSSTTTALGSQFFSTNAALNDGAAIPASQVGFTTNTISGWSIARTTATFASGAVDFVMYSTVSAAGGLGVSDGGFATMFNATTYYWRVDATDGLLTTASSTGSFVTGYLVNLNAYEALATLVTMGVGKSITATAPFGFSRVNSAKLLAGANALTLTPSGLTEIAATLNFDAPSTLKVGPGTYDVDFLDTQGNIISGRSVGANPLVLTVLYDTGTAVTVSVGETTQDGIVSVTIPPGSFTRAFSMDISTYPQAEGSITTATINSAITAGDAAVSAVGGFETDTALSGRPKQFRPLVPGTPEIVQPVASVTLGLPDAGVGGLETSKQTRSDAFRLNPNTNVWDLILAAEGADPTIAGNIVSRGINKFSIFRVGLKKAATVDSTNALIYPNPWKPNSTTDASFFATTVKIANVSGGTDITIYTINGEVVRRLNSGAADRTTTNPLTWDGTNDSGNKVASGVYIILVESSTGRVKRRLAIVR